ncbi:MAG: endonuclease/exonuclease/phosphatase family protein [Verrucomicrobiaceae bacterium]
MSLLSKTTFRNAPLILLGAFFLCTSCKPKESAPAEVEPEVPQQVTSDEPQPAATQPDPPKSTEPIRAGKDEAIRFLSYNIRNYLTMTSIRRDGSKSERSKPNEEIIALVDLIVAEKPDILGICEIGTMDDLLDLQSRLKSAGLDLPHLEHAGGADPTRRLALLSNLPISARNSAENLPYQLEGKEMVMSRGILDVTVDLPNGPTHFIGVHLKSKREIPDADQAMMRLNEAQLLRKHCDAIISKNPNARLIVYGDFNETKGEAPIAAVRGLRDSPGFLDDVWAKDSRREFWTHYWKYQDQYARFDYVFFSRSMKPEMDFKNSYIVDPIDYYDASDHRAIMVTLGR